MCGFLLCITKRIGFCAFPPQAAQTHGREGITPPFAMRFRALSLGKRPAAEAREVPGEAPRESGSRARSQQVTQLVGGSVAAQVLPIGA